MWHTEHHFYLNLLAYGIMQEWFRYSECCGNDEHNNKRRTIATLHATHVPHPGALACEAQLQGVLACKDVYY